MSQREFDRLNEWKAGLGTSNVLLAQRINCELDRAARQQDLTRKQLDSVLSGECG